MGHGFLMALFVPMAEMLEKLLPDADARLQQKVQPFQQSYLEGSPVVLQATISMLLPAMCFATSLLLLYRIARELGAAQQDADPLARALISGFAEQVSRAYTGVAFAVRSDAVRELERLEMCLENVAKKRPPLTRMSGSVVTALPAGELVQPCVLRVPKDSQPHPRA